MAWQTLDERINTAYKMVFSIQGTTNTSDALGRNWYEEPFPWAPLLTSEDVWIDTVPWAEVGQGDTIQSSHPTVIDKIELKMTKKSGYNSRIWAVHETYNDENSSMLGNFLLPQKFGPGWTARFFQDDGAGNPGQEITTTEGAWVFSYKTGLLILGVNHTASDESWAEPIHIIGYRYIGKTVKDLSASAGNKNVEYFNVNSQETEFTLSGTPTNPSQTEARINGLPMFYGSNRDFTIDGNKVKFKPHIFGFNIDKGDLIQVIWL